MNDRKLEQLFDTAKSDAAPAPNEGFAFLVMQQIQHNPARAELAVSDVISMWFPRLAVLAAAVIAICVVSEMVISSNAPSLSESAAQLSVPLVAEN